MTPINWTKDTQSAAYHNLAEFAVAIVAVITKIDGEIMDWAAYIGGSLSTQQEQVAIDGAVERGNKLTPREAMFYFPHLPAEKYRV